MGADAFITFQPGNLPGTDSIFFYEGILRNAFLLHSIPKVVVNNQMPHLFLLE